MKITELNFNLQKMGIRQLEKKDSRGHIRKKDQLLVVISFVYVKKKIKIKRMKTKSQERRLFQVLSTSV